MGEQMEDEEDDYEYHGMETDVGEEEFESSVNTKMKGMLDEPQDDSMNVDTEVTPISTDYRPGLYRYDSAAIPSSKLYGRNGLEHDEEYGDEGYFDDGYFDDYDEADAEEEQVNFLFTDGEEMFSPNSLAQGLIDVDALGLQPL